MENTGKRTTRQLDARTRQKISKALAQYWKNMNTNNPVDTERHEGTGRGWIESGDII